MRRVSSFYVSEPQGFAAQPLFVNAVARVSWSGTPAALLRLCRSIERALGRVATFPNGPRIIDLDVLDFGGRIRRSPDPVLPHPRLASRRFVLAPLAEIAPRWKHPETGRRAGELLACLPRRPWARRIPARG